MENFWDKFESFFNGCQEIINKEFKIYFPNNRVPKLTYKNNKKYIRIMSENSAYCFIDKITGDVLKPANYNTPAKGSRGNIFDEFNGLKRMSCFGPEYNR